MSLTLRESEPLPTPATRRSDRSGSTSPRRRSRICAGVSRPRAGPRSRRSGTPRRACGSPPCRPSRGIGSTATTGAGRRPGSTLPPVPDRDRWARHPLHPRPLEARGCPAADRHPRLAGLDHRAAEDHRAADGSDRARRQRRRRLPRGHPSLPGHGFSGKPTEPGWDPPRIARAWAVLMKRLGYERFVAQGGDWGNAVSEQMALQEPPGLLGIPRTWRRRSRPRSRKALADGAPPPAGSQPRNGVPGTQLVHFFYKKGLGYAQRDGAAPADAVRDRGFAGRARRLDARSRRRRATS